MTIRLNGESHELTGPLTVAALLATLDIDARRVAVEHNLIVVKRAAYDSTMVNEGDEVEIVNFVGGGAPQDVEEDRRSTTNANIAQRSIHGPSERSSARHTPNDQPGLRLRIETPPDTR